MNFVNRNTKIVPKINELFGIKNMFVDKAIKPNRVSEASIRAYRDVANEPLSLTATRFLTSTSICLKPIWEFPPYIAADIDTVEIVERRSRKKMSAEEMRVDIRNLWERVALKLLSSEERCEMQAVLPSNRHLMMYLGDGSDGFSSERSLRS